MKKLILAIFMPCALVTVMAQEEEPRELAQARASYQSQVKFAKQSYLQKLESMRKMPSMTKSQVDAIQAEIDSVRGQAAVPVADVPDSAPEKPGVKTADIKAGKLTEFPKDITSADWDRLPGKVIRVNAAEESYYGKDPVSVKDGDFFYAVPHPTDRWNLSKKVSCNWEGVPNDRPGCSGIRIGRLTMSISKVEGKQQGNWHSMEVKTLIEGPVKVGFSSGSSYEQLPKIYYKGEIRVKLVPAE
ncbi:MAG: hypothetical protein WAX69_12665 [Victivallales bacterium]